MKKNATYSSTFHIVLNPDLPVTHDSLEINDQYKELKDVLKRSLIELEEATEKRIQEYQAKQEILLTREKEKAMYDGAILWQAMKEVSRTIHEEQKRHIRKPSSSSHFHQVPRITEEHPPPIEHRRRSSAIRRDLLGGQSHIIHRRRSSFVLDESAIARSFKNTTHHLEPVPEQQYTEQAHPEHVHPLAAPTSSSSSWIDESLDTSSQKHDDDDDDLFALDEDDQDMNKRHSVKYIPSEDEDEDSPIASPRDELQVPEITGKNKEILITNLIILIYRNKLCNVCSYSCT